MLLFKENIEIGYFLLIIAHIEDKRINEWVDDRQRGGYYSFSLPELPGSASGSDSALRQSLQRLQRKNRIRRLRRQFYVILPVEYARLGMIPADWFIDDLMAYLGQPYYIGLFSAANLHGAGHQQAQTYQVMTSALERPIETAGLNLRFFQKKSLQKTPTRTVKGHTGMLPVSTHAATALDLVAYANRIGGLDAILTPLAELCEDMSAEDLIESARHEMTLSVVQRLGWLLDKLGQSELGNELEAFCRDALAGASRVPLDPAAPRRGGSENRWRVIENAEPEGDV